MTDNGAQAERTRLAWRRTILTATIVSVLSVRHALESGGSAGRLLAGLLALTWVALCVGAQIRINQLAHAQPAALRSPWPAMASAVVLALALLAALTLL